MSEFDEQVYDDDLPDDPRVAQLEAAVGSLYAQQYEDHLGTFAAEFPEFTTPEAAQRLVETAAERAAAMAAPHLANDVRHIRHVAADLRMEAQAEAARPRTYEERFNSMLERHSKRVLPFG